MKPFITTASRAKYGYMAALDAQLVDRIEKLWSTFYGSQQVVTFAVPDAAPLITGLSTDAYGTVTYTFAQTAAGQSANFELPWFLQKNHDAIHARVLVASLANMSMDLQVRMRALSMDTVFATVTGAWADAGAADLFTPPTEWFVDALTTDLLFQEFVCSIPIASPSADRRFMLDFQAQFTNPGSVESIPNVAVSRPVRIVGMQIMDVPVVRS